MTNKIDTKQLNINNIYPLDYNDNTYNKKVVSNNIYLNSIIMNSNNYNIAYENKTSHTETESLPITQTTINTDILPYTTLTYRNLCVDNLGNIWCLFSNNTNSTDILIFNSDFSYINKLSFTNTSDFIPKYICHHKPYGKIYLASDTEIRRYNIDYTYDNINKTGLTNLSTLKSNNINLYYIDSSSNKHLLDINLNELNTNNEYLQIIHEDVKYPYIYENYTLKYDINYNPDIYRLTYENSYIKNGLNIIIDNLNQIWFYYNIESVYDIRQEHPGKILSIYDINYKLLQLYDFDNNEFIKNSISYIYEDHLHNMWICGNYVQNTTDYNCLVMENKTFTIINSYKKNTTFLEDIIRCVEYYNDDIGYIMVLVGTNSDSNNPECVFINNNDNKYTIIQTINRSEFNNDGIYNVIIDKNNNLIMSVAQNIYVYTYNKNTIKFELKLHFTTNTILTRYLLVDKYNHLWVGCYSWGGLPNMEVYDLNNPSSPLHSYYRTSSDTENPTFWINDIKEDRNGYIIVTGQGLTINNKKVKLSIIEPTSFKTIYNISLPILNNKDISDNNFVYSVPNIIYYDKFDRLWITGCYKTNDSPYHSADWDDNANILICYDNFPNDLSQFTDFNVIKKWYNISSDFVYNDVRCICQDNLNRFWIGGYGTTSYKTCCVFNNELNLIKYWNYREGNFIYNEVRSLYVDSLGRIWVGGSSGSADKTICCVLDNNFNIIKYWKYDQDNFVTHSVISIFEDHLGRIWLGGGVGSGTPKHKIICCVLDRYLNTIKYFNQSDNNIVNGTILCMCEDHLGRIWICGNGNTKCCVLDYKFNIIKSWASSDTNCVYSEIRCIFEDHLGRMLIGGIDQNSDTTHKICCIYDSNFNLIKYWNYGNNNFIYNRVFTICEDHHGNYWFGGVYYDSTKSICRILDKDFNLIKSWNYSNSNIVYRSINKIYEDNQNRIFIIGQCNTGDGNDKITACVLDNTYNIINNNNISFKILNDNYYNKINLNSFDKTNQLGDIYGTINSNNKNYYNNKSKITNQLPNNINKPTNTSSNSSIINNNTNYINNKYKYIYNTSNINVENYKSDIIYYTQTTLSNKFKLSNNFDNITYNISCSIIYNNKIIIGYHDIQPNLFVYKYENNEFKIDTIIYNSNDNINSICIYKDYLVVGFDNYIRFYNKDLKCIYIKYIKYLKYVNTDNNYLYIVSFNELQYYIFNDNILMLCKCEKINNINKIFIINGKLHYIIIDDIHNITYSIYNNTYKLSFLNYVNYYDNNIYVIKNNTLYYLDDTFNTNYICNININNYYLGIIKYNEKIYFYWSEFIFNNNSYTGNYIYKLSFNIIENTKKIIIKLENGILNRINIITNEVEYLDL